MATISKWEPFGVALNITATGATVTRKSATQFTVKINASWKTYYSGARTNYGMTASSGGGTATINKFGTKASSGSGSFIGTYTISGNGAATKTITVTFENFNNDNGKSATKNVSFSVSVPAWTSYTIEYNANGGNGAPSSQTKWKDQTLTLSSTKPARTGYTFLGWSTSSSATSATYAAGGSYTTNSAATLYAVWKANTYTVKYDANGGSGAPGNQTKTYGQTLTLSSTKPTRTNYNFKGWGISASATTVSYSAGGSYTKNAAITLYAIWEVGYAKPRITNVIVGRCNSSKVLTDDGKYVLASFDWATDLSVTSISIEDKKQSSSTWTGGTFQASGTSGTINALIKSNMSTTFDLECSYQVRITVSDGSDDAYSTSLIKTIPSMCMPIDVRPPKCLLCSDCGEYYDNDLKTAGYGHYCGYMNSNPSNSPGVAIGKTAEYRNVFDVGLQIRSQRGFYPERLETSDGSGVDLNDIKIPNVYASINKQASTYTNLPDGVTGTFTLEVLSAGAEGQIWQRLTTCSKASSTTYERFYYSATWGDWHAVHYSEGQRLLHTDGGRYMTAGHTISLSKDKALSNQPNGYLLVWSIRINGTNYYYDNNYTFIPRYQLIYPGTDLVMPLVRATSGTIGAKCIAVTEADVDGVITTTITGNDTNGQSPNNNWVLRQVLGV